MLGQTNTRDRQIVYPRVRRNTAQVLSAFQYKKGHIYPPPGGGYITDILSAPSVTNTLVPKTSYSNNCLKRPLSSVESSYAALTFRTAENE
jgi:hypothetical protein